MSTEAYKTKKIKSTESKKWLEMGSRHSRCKWVIDADRHESYSTVRQET